MDHVAQIRPQPLLQSRPDCVKFAYSANLADVQVYVHVHVTEMYMDERYNEHINISSHSQ